MVHMGVVIFCSLFQVAVILLVYLVLPAIGRAWNRRKEARYCRDKGRAAVRILAAQEKLVEKQEDLQYAVISLSGIIRNMFGDAADAKKREEKLRQ